MEGFYRMSLCLGLEEIKKGAAQFEIAYKKTLEELGYGKDKKCEKKDEKLEEPAKNATLNN